MVVSIDIDLPVGIFTTVAEIHTIELCANKILDRRIQRLSYSQAALKAVVSFKTDFRLVWNCMDRPNR